MDKYIVLTNTDKDKDLEVSNRILDALEKAGAKGLLLCDVSEKYDGDVIKKEVLDEAKAAIVVGGDGTMLRSANAIGNSGLPLVGINLGTVGFLTEIEKKNLESAIERLVKEDYKIESRMMITGTVFGKEYNSLNDIVVTRAGFSRVIGLSVYVNDKKLDTYEADGVIIATPTGSTGYNMSAGGPIISPMSKAIVVTPISPHSFTSRSIVFAPTDKIRIEIEKKRKTQETEAIVSFDGTKHFELSAGDSVEAKISTKELKLIKMDDNNFYSVLRDKLGGNSL